MLNRLCLKPFTHGCAVELRAPHGPAECPDLRGGGPAHKPSLSQGGAAVQGAPNGQEERGARVVPGAQGLLRHDPEAALHGPLQVTSAFSLSEPLLVGRFGLQRYRQCARPTSLQHLWREAPPSPVSFALATSVQHGSEAF